MKRTNIFISILLLATLFLTVSCREKELISDDIDIPGLGGTEEVPNELDAWLFDNYTQIYNIDVVYRWDAAQMYSSLSGSKLVPVKYEAVKPMMAAMRDVWFQPYIQACGNADFLKRMAPKKIVLVGSPEFLDGAIKLGQAEGGRKILLLNANSFDASDEEGLKQALQTIEHEFAHILHQTILFSKEYQELSSGFYDSAGWTQFNDKEAYQLGFVSAYSMSGKDEDFVEVLSMILVYGYDWFKNTVLPVAAESTENPKAHEILLKKVAMVETYFKESWNIQFLDDAVTGTKGLEGYVRDAISAVSTNPPTE